MTELVFKTFKRGIPYLELQRPCTIGDGIIALQKSDLDRLNGIYLDASSSARAMKFVPASGAASRMFKSLLSFNNNYVQIDKESILAKAKEDDPSYESFLQFINSVRHFAFYDDLKAIMSKDGLDIEAHISEGLYKAILEYLLDAKGLNYANLPKGLIKFHRYTDHSRTPFEEHLVEAAAYTKDRNGICRVHFTIPSTHEEAIKDHMERIVNRNEALGYKYEIAFSIQKTSTDTIAVDSDNSPFRNREGRLLFRPGGHGALLENLNDLNGDMVFIKNIDNVVPDRLKHETNVYKKAFGGFLVELQNELFGYLDRLANKDVDAKSIEQIFEFARHRLYLIPPDGVRSASKEGKIDFLFSRLNRPIRICGMVKNEGEPGGGPFWVKNRDMPPSLQIVESSQVDLESNQQRDIWESSTHFNPVDLLCGVQDYQGRPFNLTDFADPNTGFISIKSKDGRELKALELPGLWNGAMCYWNTVFIEAPIITFNPVKTLNDLLREEHVSFYED
jgi:hypothetical protein